MAESMLTTVDNPFNPFTQFDEWYNYDLMKGYGTSSYLARVVQTSEDLSEASQSVAIEQAIDEIIRENPLGIYRRVSMQTQDSA